MTSPSRAYFPLRSNAASLIAGAGVASVRRRIKHASLLHDEVLLEDGQWDLIVAEQGHFSIWRPPFYQPQPTWETPRGRHIRKSGTVKISTGKRDDPASERDVLTTRSTLYLQPTLAPIRRELPSGCDWIAFGHFGDPQLTKELEAKLVPEALDEALRVAYPDSFARALTIKYTSVDLAIGSAVGAAISCDRRHARVLSARMSLGEASPVLGGLALSILVPAELTWHEVAELRAARGPLHEFRAVLRDVEAVARDMAGSPQELRDHIREAYGQRLATAAAKRLSIRAQVATSAIGLGVGHVAGVLIGLPVVAETVGAAAGIVAGEVGQMVIRPKWLSVHDRVQSMRQTKAK